VSIGQRVAHDLLRVAAVYGDVRQVVCLEVEVEGAWYDYLQRVDLAVDEDEGADFAGISVSQSWSSCQVLMKTISVWFRKKLPMLSEKSILRSPKSWRLRMRACFWIFHFCF